MTSPAPTPPTPTPTPAPASPGAAEPPTGRRSAQIALAVFLAILGGMLAFRGYGNRLGARPVDSVGATRLDLNRADRVDLEQVPTIGPKLAGAIDDHRRENGPFRSIDDLRGVKGVGPATLDKVRPYLQVEGADPAPPTSANPSGPDPPLATRVKSPPRAAPPTTSGNSPAAPRASGAKKLQPGDPPINVNTASADELQRLPAVGPVAAQNIIAARNAQPFRSLADLDRVKGIGPKTLEKLRPFVVME